MLIEGLRTRELAKLLRDSPLFCRNAALAATDEDGDEDGWSAESVLEGCEARCGLV